MRLHAKALLAVVAVFTVLGAPSALAAKATLHRPHPFSFSGSGALSAIAIDQGSGDVYVVNSSANSVDKFDASGTPSNFSSLASSSLDGSATPAGSFAFADGQTVANAIAIDESGTATDGNLYVADPGHGTVNVFDKSGTYKGRLIGSTIPSGPFGKPDGLAVDGAGNLYIADAAKNRIYKYASTANPPIESDYASTISGDGQLNAPAGLAFDQSGGANDGDLYVVNYRNGGAPALNRFDATGAVLEQTIDFSGQSTAVAVDQSNGDVYADDGAYVAHYAPNGSPVSVVGEGAFIDSLGVALDSTSKIYASDSILGSVPVFAAGVEVETPTASIEAVTDITTESAKFHGKVNPNGSGPLSKTSYHFEASRDQVNWVPLVGQGPIEGLGDLDVSIDASDNFEGIFPQVEGEESSDFGLAPGKHYFVRLVASNAASEPTGGPTVSAEVVEFDTAPIAPTVRNTAPTSGVTGTAATIHATINPHGAQTTFHVEYGTDTSYGLSAPLADAPVGTGVKPLAVSQALTGLSPSTTYHYRIVATNSVGTSEGIDHAFKTVSTLAEADDTCANAAIRAVQGAGGLGDCRAYEMVSPVEKNGGDIVRESFNTRAAADGSAAMFTSLSGFAGTPGSGSMIQYMGVRTPSGWQTHSLMPQQEPQHGRNVTLAVPPIYYDFSADLAKGVFRALSPLTDAPLVANTRNLYLREGLRAPGGTSSLLLTDSELPLPAFGQNPNLVTYRPELAGASADFSHVVFDSRLNLTSQATGTATKLYEWAEGEVRLVGILPEGEPASCPSPSNTACSTASRSNRKYPDNTISRDGSRILFNSPVSSADSLTPESQLYMRIDGTKTVRVNASEKAVPHSANCADSGTPPPCQAEFAAASADLSQVFFMSDEQLIEGDNDSTIDLYRYDAGKPEDDPHNLTRVARGVNSGGGGGGVAGLSDDASYVYVLTSSLQGVPGEPGTLSSDSRALYVLHDGQLRFIGIVPEIDAINMIASGGPSLTVRTARVTSDGSHFAFLSDSGDGLTGYDHGSCVVSPSGRCPEMYVYDAEANSAAGKLSCASCNPSGAPATTHAAFFSGGGGQDLATTHLSQALSTDGKRAFFMTRERLLPEDRNGTTQDVYQYDVDTEELHLVSPGTSSLDAYFLDASDSGDDVFFITREQLVGSDIDNAYDLYDARVGGGFPEPVPAPVCEGDSCITPPTPPNDPTPASSTYSGAGNAKPTPNPRCPKGRKATKRKGKSRCAPKQHKRDKRANANRRASR